MSFRLLAVVLHFVAGAVLSNAAAHAQDPDGHSGSEWTSIRAAYEDARHRVFEGREGFEARAHRQQYSSRFDGRGVTITPDGGDWSFGLTLAAYGRGPDVVPVDRPVETTREARRLEYRWDERVTEWYVNGDDGLEHGFTVSERPIGADGGSGLRFDLCVLGDLAPVVDPSGLAIALFDARGEIAATYGGLFVTDAEGRELGARMSTIPGGISILVDDSEASYPLTIDPIIQQAYVKASNTDQGDRLGFSVAIDGNTLVVGAPGEDSAAIGVNGNQADDSAGNSGAVFVFTRANGTWMQEAYLKPSNTGSGDDFGHSVAIAGDTIVVGARDEESSATGVNGDDSDNSLPFAGAAYVFTRTDTTWSQQAYLKASNTGEGDQFGVRVKVAGETIVVAANQEDSSATGVDGDQTSNSANAAGAVYVFVRKGTDWSQQAYIKASNTQGGDQFGHSLDFDGHTLVVGAISEDSAATGVNGDESSNAISQSGAAYVFIRSGSTWVQEAYLKASNTGQFDQFGFAVAIDGDTAVVGAQNEDSDATGVNGTQTNNFESNSGAAYVFTRSSGSWSQEAYLKASNTWMGDVFGTSLDIEGDVLVVCATGEDGVSTGVNGSQENGVPNSGAAYVFERSASTWVQSAYLKASTTDTSDELGISVAIRGTTLVVGSQDESSAATGVNGDESDDSMLQAGAVFVFDLEPDWCIVPGCHGNTATFSVPTLPARIDTTVEVELVGSTVSEGAVAMFYGANGTDAFGCGIQLSPIEEQLLANAPMPVLHTFSSMSGGQATTRIVVPNQPAIVGVRVTLQAVAVDPLVPTCEFSNGLEFVIRP